MKGIEVKRLSWVSTVVLVRGRQGITEAGGEEAVWWWRQKSEGCNHRPRPLEATKSWTSEDQILLWSLQKDFLLPQLDPSPGFLASVTRRENVSVLSHCICRG